MWKPNPRAWRVICQKCGKVGIIDNFKTAEENGFINQFFSYVDEMGYIQEVEYWLCMDCYREQIKEEISCKN